MPYHDFVLIISMRATLAETHGLTNMSDALFQLVLELETATLNAVSK